MTEPISVPLNEKITLTVHEAAALTNIGINKIHSLLREPNCSFALYVGNKKLVKRKEFEAFISKQVAV